MPRPLTPLWVRCETALSHIARAYGYPLDRSEAGDIIAHEVLILPDTDTVDDLNLTELAKDLAKELEL